MRLGTRSCAECRRRKVRCIFPHQSHTCLECAAHDTPCRKQGTINSISSEDLAASENVQKRLEDLEQMVRTICQAVDLNMESSSNDDFQSTTTEALRRLAGPSSLERRNGDAFEGQTDSGRSESRWTSPDDIGFSSDRSLDDAPLMSLFKQAMVIQMDDEMTTGDRLDFAAKRQIGVCIDTLNTLLPEPTDLSLILELTARYWTIWPVWPITPNYPSSEPDSNLSNHVAQGREFILGSFRSRKAATVAKAVLWLALCIQQLPKSFYDLGRSLPEAPSLLLESYMTGAEALLNAIKADTGSSIEALESFLLQAKVHINMGKPRKAWLSVRFAMDAAILLGLHHSEGSASKEDKKLWTSLWQFERQLSLIQGFPSAISSSHSSLSLEMVGGLTVPNIMHGLSIVAGLINDRNSSSRKNDYSVTLKIEEQLNQYRDMIPRDWWDVTPDSGLPLQMVYSQRVAVFQLCLMYKHLHLPFMLKPSIEGNLEHSRATAMASSRQMLRAYDTFRNSSQCAMINCDLMDFHAFSAAIVLVIDLTSNRSGPRDVYQDALDWEMIAQLLKNLQHISQAMDCAVAEQAAQVLDYLIQAHRGLYADTEPFEVTIPYFGKVRISKVPREHFYGETSLSSSGFQTNNARDASKTLPYANTIELSADSFAPLGRNPILDSTGDAELNADWTEVLDQGFDYDWNQTFYDNGSMGSNIYI